MGTDDSSDNTFLDTRFFATATPHLSQAQRQHQQHLHNASAQYKIIPIVNKKISRKQGNQPKKEKKSKKMPKIPPPPPPQNKKLPKKNSPIPSFA
jgi:hypothetical protein